MPIQYGIDFQAGNYTPVCIYTCIRTYKCYMHARARARAHTHTHTHTQIYVIRSIDKITHVTHMRTDKGQRGQVALDPKIQRVHKYIKLCDA